MLDYYFLHIIFGSYHNSYAFHNENEHRNAIVIISAK